MPESPAAPEIVTIRATCILEEVEAMIAKETAAKGVSIGGHPARRWLHCSRCGTWHRPEEFDVRDLRERISAAYEDWCRPEPILKDLLHQDIRWQLQGAPNGDTLRL